jgi:hypothetical protein
VVGCASTQKKGANKNLFEEALVLQEVKAIKPQGARVNKADSINRVQWTFDETQYQPNSEQKRQLFLWFSQVENYSNNPVVLQLGPDWMSSYKRGNNLRKMIPRGIIIEQQFDNNLPKNEVVFTFKSSLVTLEKGGSNESSSQ